MAWVINRLNGLNGFRVRFVFLKIKIMLLTQDFLEHELNEYYEFALLQQGIRL